jgi:virginiamycin B lyase
MLESSSHESPFFKICRFAIRFGMSLALEACGSTNSLPASAAKDAILPEVISSIPVTATLPSSAKPVSVTIKYILPTNRSEQAGFERTRLDRKLQYVSASNSLIGITVTPLGGTPATYGPSACSSTACVVSFTTVPGPATLVFTLTDASSNVLSKLQTTTIIQPETINTLAFTANPVVNSVALQLASTNLNGGTSADDLLTVKALDADGNTIIGSSRYVDHNGDPVTLNLDVNNTQAGGHGTVAIKGPLAITAASQAVAIAHYDGNALTSSTISVSSSSSTIIAPSNANINIQPTINHEFTLPTASSLPIHITAAPDGNLWFTEYTANKIGRITTGGIFTEFTIPTASSDTSGITTGPDGNVWFTETIKDKIGRVTSQGVFTEFNVPTTGIQPFGIITGPDGAMWFTENTGSKIGRVTTNGVFTEFAIPSPPLNFGGIIVGPDSNLWFTESNTNKIGRITINGIVTEFSVPTASSSPEGIVLGPDGKIWFTEESANKIGQVTTSGVFTEFAIPTSSSNPLNIIVAPDGNLWFTEYASNKIGRVTTSGVFTEFTLPVAASNPIDIKVAADGNLWFTESAGNKIGVLTY